MRRKIRDKNMNETIITPFPCHLEDVVNFSRPNINLFVQVKRQKPIAHFHDDIT